MHYHDFKRNSRSYSKRLAKSSNFNRFQILLAPDVALTQAIVGAAIVPVFIALAVKKTQRSDS